MLRSLFYFLTYKKHLITYLAFLLVQQFYTQFNYFYRTFLKVTLLPFLLFCCIRAIRKGGDRQQCVTCACLEVSDLGLKCHALGNSSFLNDVEIHHPRFFSLSLFFNLFPYPDYTLFSTCFFSLCFPLGLLHLSSPKNPFCKTLPPPSTLLCPLLSLTLLLFLTTLYFTVLFSKQLLILFLMDGEVKLTQRDRFFPFFFFS